MISGIVMLDTVLTCVGGLESPKQSFWDSHFPQEPHPDTVHAASEVYNSDFKIVKVLEIRWFHTVCGFLKQFKQIESNYPKSHEN